MSVPVESSYYEQCSPLQSPLGEIAGLSCQWVAELRDMDYNQRNDPTDLHQMVELVVATAAEVTQPDDSVTATVVRQTYDVLGDTAWDGAEPWDGSEPWDGAEPVVLADWVGGDAGMEVQEEAQAEEGWAGSKVQSDVPPPLPLPPSREGEVPTKVTKVLKNAVKKNRQGILAKTKNAAAEKAFLRKLRRGRATQFDICTT
jgi:hypothetical protein